MTNFLATLLPFFILIPAVPLCCLPMKNQFIYPFHQIIVISTASMLVLIPPAAWSCQYFQVSTNTALLPLLCLLFPVYYRTLKTDLARTLVVYLDTCALLSFSCEAGYAIDAWLHPEATYVDYPLELSLLQNGISLLFLLLFAFPFLKYFSWTIDHMEIPVVWYAVIPVPILFTAVNIIIIPHSYATLYTNRMFFVYIAVEIILFLFFLLLHILVYHIISILLKYAQTQEHIRFLQMQAEQYQHLQNYIRQTEKLRHDFRHSVHALSIMADNGETEQLKSHLHSYEQALRIATLSFYCSNAALNALFNYYHQMAQSNGIKTDWDLELPEPLTISELDMLCLLGNILENAITGCQTVPEEQRYFSLSIKLQNKNCLYIVSTNSFDGVTKKRHNAYLSTKHAEEGIGLYSIRTIAGKYSGIMQASHNSKEFLVDVMLKL